MFERLVEKLFPKNARQKEASAKFDASVTRAYNIFRHEKIEPVVELAKEQGMLIRGLQRDFHENH